VDAFLAAALTRVMCAAVPIPAVVAAPLLRSAAVVGSVIGDVGPLWRFGSPTLNSCELSLVSFDLNVDYSSC